MRGPDDELESSSLETASEEDDWLLAALATYADPARSPQATHMATRVLSIARPKQAGRRRLKWTAVLLLPAAVFLVTIIVTYLRPGAFPAHKEQLAAHASRDVLPLPASSSVPPSQVRVAGFPGRRYERASKQASTAERPIEPVHAKRAIFPTPLPLSREEQLMLVLVKTSSPVTQQLLARMTEPLLPSRIQADSFPRLSENQPQGVSDEMRH